MPELPEVETVRRGLASAISGSIISNVALRRDGLRIPFPSDLIRRLVGARVVAVDRRAKYLVLHLESAWNVIWHLGMSGRVLVRGPQSNREPPGPHDHLIIDFDNETTVVFNDPRRFGLVDLAAPGTLETNRHLARLGLEPFDPVFTGAFLKQRLAGRQAAIKACLLDQSVVAGLGNIYVCESLYHARLSPLRPGRSLSVRQSARLVAAIRKVLTAAIDSGGSSLRDYVGTAGELGYFQHSFAVYGRAGSACPDCRCDIDRTGGISRIVQANRSTFHCAVNQT